MRAELPVALYSLFPIQAATARRAGTAEWSSSCPNCGGKDRFRIFAANGQAGDRYWCRVCNLKGFMDGKDRLTPEQLQQADERRRVWREREESDRQRRVAELENAAYWRGYHDALRDVGRAAWEARGLDAQAQDWFEVGIAQWDNRPALSIPFHTRDWSVETIQYRLLDADGKGKYRFEKGYPATAYWTRPPKPDWPYIICEGAIKAMVVYWRLVIEGDRPYNVVAVTGKTPGKAQVERLAEEIGEGEALLLLDPDATTDQRYRVGVNFNNVRYVTLPDKVDDLLVGGDLGVHFFEKVYLAQATMEPL